MKYNAKTLERIGKVLDSANGLAASEFSPIINRAIVAAASERSSLELKQKAWMLVYNSLHPFIVKTVRPFAMKGNMEDYMNDFFIVIMENLERWRPEKGKLITFFAPLLEKSCNVTQFKEQTFTSMYYRDTYIDITKVIDELAVRGIVEPTEKQIYSALKKKGLKYAKKTIRETMYQNVRIVSLDSPNEEDNCLLDILTTETKRNKKQEDTKKTIESLSGTSQVIINAECKFYEENTNRKKMHIGELQEAVQTTLGDVSTSWLLKKRRSAEREFIHVYNALKAVDEESVRVS